jgi:hypothetical protein
MSKRFHLHRTVDSSGISGTGDIAEGVEFVNGMCVLTWLTKHSSVAVYKDIGDVEAIHGHQGNTKIIWDDA